MEASSLAMRKLHYIKPLKDSIMQLAPRSMHLTSPQRRRRHQSIFHGLEFLTVSGPTPTTAASGADGETPLHTLLMKKKEMIGPEMFMSKEICAYFRAFLIVRAAYKGTIFFSTLPRKQAARKETEFSFRAEGSSRIRRAALISYYVSNLASGISCETSLKEEPILL